MAQLRLILFSHGGCLCLYVRLPGGRRMLIDCSPGPAKPPLAFLRACGEVGPLHPLDQYLRPGLEPPELESWLSLLSLMRGLVLRPGGAWLIWQAEESPRPGFALRARALPLNGPPLAALEQAWPPLLVLGLSPAEVASLGGPCRAWIANSSLALMTPAPGGDFLLGGDLRAAAWQRLLAAPQVNHALHQVRCFAAGEPPAGPAGYDLGRGFLMAALPWLAMGALAQADPQAAAWPGQPSRKTGLATPPVGALSIEVADSGEMRATAWPHASDQLIWQGLSRPLNDPSLPAPWPLRRALASC